MERRAFMTAIAATPLAAAGAAIDEDAQLDAILAIHDRTGVSIDDLVDWLEGVDVERISQNVKKAPSIVWGPVRTRAAVSSFKSGEILGTGADPSAKFSEAQIRMKADPATLKKYLANFERSAEHYPALMDMA